MKKAILLIANLIVCFGAVYAKGLTNNPATKNLFDLTNNYAPKIAANSVCTPQNTSLSFIENIGQITNQDGNSRRDIQFSVKAAAGVNIFIGNGAIHYQFSKAQKQDVQHEAAKRNRQNIDAGTPEIEMYRMDVKLIGANKNARIITSEKQEYCENYYTAATEKETNVTAHTFRKITYENIYPHIDWVLYVSNGKLKHEFVVHKGGQAADIQLRYSGATDLAINADGSLVAATPQGTVTELMPSSYQEDGKKIQSAFKLTGHVLSYQIAGYSGPLTIDPTLMWGTYYGGPVWEQAFKMTTDHSGNIYQTGETTSTSNIATTGAFQVTYGGGVSGGYESGDAFLAKFSSSGTLLWATYYGGTQNDWGMDVATDTFGNVYMAGATISTSGIATPGAYQATNAGGTEYGDCFLVKFNSSGTRQWATYFGGSGDESGNGVATDNAGNVYITGLTSSASGISTPGAYQTVYSGGGLFSAFLAKFNGAGAVQWATYFGGSSQDEAWKVATDSSANVYICGQAASTSGIATTGAYQTAFAGGGSDAFIAKFTTGGSILWSTYYGGSSTDIAYGISVNDSGSLYLTGNALSTSGIATPGAYQTVNSSSLGDAFLAKFTTSGSIQWATYYGGNVVTYGHCVASDDSGYVYIVGETTSPTGIATTGAYDTVLNRGVTGFGAYDAYLAKFTSAGALKWATYYGGTGNEEGWGLATVGAMSVYLSGSTMSTSFIATPGAYQVTEADGGAWGDAFLVKFNNCTRPDSGTVTGPSSVCSGRSIALTDTVAGGTWSASNGHATITAGIIAGLTAGLDTIGYTVTNACGSAMATLVVTVNPIAVAGAISGKDTVCLDSVSTFSDTISGGDWSVSDTAIAVVSAGTIRGKMAGIDTIRYTVANACDTATAQKIIHIVTDCKTGVENISLPSGDILVYPNPATDELIIENAAAGGAVKLFNIIGEQVYRGAVSNNKLSVNLRNLVNGLYILQIAGMDGSRLNRTILKQ